LNPHNSSSKSISLFNRLKFFLIKKQTEIEAKDAKAHSANDLLYVGPHALTQKYAPTILPLCPSVLMSARATARLAGDPDVATDAQA